MDLFLVSIFRVALDATLMTRSWLLCEINHLNTTIRASAEQPHVACNVYICMCVCCNCINNVCACIGQPRRDIKKGSFAKSFSQTCKCQFRQGEREREAKQKRSRVKEKSVPSYMGADHSRKALPDKLQPNSKRPDDQCLARDGTGSRALVDSVARQAQPRGEQQAGRPIMRLG
jgi:hypothetical protein